MKITDIVTQLARHPTLRYEFRPLSAIDGISLHHSADEGDPWAWARYHITPVEQGGPAWTPDGEGAPGIAYHCAVMRDGRIYKCQLDTTKSWHTADHNYHLIGIVCQGDFTRRPPAEAQLRSLLWVVRHYMAAYPTIKLANVRAHREWQEGGTSCPGTWLATAVRASLEKEGD